MIPFAYKMDVTVNIYLMGVIISCLAAGYICLLLFLVGLFGLTWIGYIYGFYEYFRGVRNQYIIGEPIPVYDYYPSHIIFPKFKRRRISRAA